MVKWNGIPTPDVFGYVFVVANLCYIWGVTLEAIKEAIEKLPPDQQTVLASWLSERDWKSWDEQIQHDFSPGGRGMPLLAELEQEIAGGKVRPMEEGFASRRK